MAERTPDLLHGVIPALVTPRREDESVDPPTLGRVIDHVLDAGVHGLFVLGGQGEGWTLTQAQRDVLLAAAVEHAAGRVPVLAGITSPTTKQAIELGRQAAALGAAYVVSMPPTVTPTSDAELAGYFAEIGDAVGVPLVLYNHPIRSGRSIPIDVVDTLAAHPRIVAIKDSDGAFGRILALLDRLGDRMSVIVGNDDLIAPGLLAGCSGAIASTANVVPTLVVAIHDAVCAGDATTAMRWQRELHRLRAAFDLGTFPVVVKEAMAVIGIPVGPAPAPTKPLSPKAREQLVDVLANIAQPHREPGRD